MRIEKTNLEGCIIIHENYGRDERGYFMESYNQKAFFALTGLSIDFVQDNQSLSRKGVLRGLHFQNGDAAQAKLVRVLEGEVLDVVVDLRRTSATFGQHFSVILSAQNHTQLFVPRGFAHGFLVLSEEAVFFYKCDNYYNPAAEGGIIFNDPDLEIDWKLPESELLLSAKDKLLPTLQEVMPALKF